MDLTDILDTYGYLIMAALAVLYLLIELVKYKCESDDADDDCDSNLDEDEDDGSWTRFLCRYLLERWSSLLPSSSDKERGDANSPCRPRSSQSPPPPPRGGSNSCCIIEIEAGSQSQDDVDTKIKIANNVISSTSAAPDEAEESIRDSLEAPTRTGATTKPYKIEIPKFQEFWSSTHSPTPASPSWNAPPPPPTYDDVMRMREVEIGLSSYVTVQ